MSKKKDATSTTPDQPEVPKLDLLVARDANGKVTVFVTNADPVPDPVSVVVNGRHVWEGQL